MIKIALRGHGIPFSRMYAQNLPWLTREPLDIPAGFESLKQERIELIGLLVRAAVAVRATSMVRTNPGSRMGARRAPASSPSCVFGPKANAEAKADHLAHDRWVYRSRKAIVGAKPQFGALRQAEVADVARACEHMKPLFAPGPAKSLRPRPLVKASLAAMSRSSPPGLSPFPGLSPKTCVGLFGFAQRHPSVLSPPLWARRA